MVKKWRIVHALKVHTYRLYNQKGVKSMLLTKNLVKFNKLLVKIPRQTKRIWDLAENRWGYKFLSKKR